MTRLLPGRAYCRTCPVAEQCLTYAIFHQIEYGVWGGLDATQRDHLIQAAGGDPLPGNE